VNIKKVLFPTHHDTLRQVLNCIGVFLQIFSAYFLQVSNFGTSVAERSATSQTPLIPAPYAFSIWGVIFFLSVVYAIYQVLPKNKKNSLLRKVGFFTAGAFFGNTLWQCVATLITFNYPTALIIILITTFCLVALFRLHEHKRKNKLSSKELWCVYVPISMLAGWVNIATFANISSVLKQLQFNYFGLSETIFSIILLALATLCTSLVVYKIKGNLVYSLTLVWAFVAIIIANMTRSQNNSLILSTVFAIISILLVNFLSEKEKIFKNFF